VNRTASNFAAGITAETYYYRNDIAPDPALKAFDAILGALLHGSTTGTRNQGHEKCLARQLQTPALFRIMGIGLCS